MKKYAYFLFLLTISMLSCEEGLFEEEPSNDPIGNFESLWSTFDERYAVFEQRGVDWKKLYDLYRPQVDNATSNDELFDIITAMLSHLDDAHVSLSAQGKPLWNAHLEFRERSKLDLFSFETIRDNYMDGPMTIIHDQYAYGTINQDVGYLYVAFLKGDKPLFIDEFIEQMKDKKGIIIDLRHNDGGDFKNGEVIAARFASKRALAFSASPKNGPGPDDYAEAVDYYIKPDGPIQFTKKVVVLTNGYTVSAAENLCLYLRVLPNTIIIGENTTGAMGERIEKEMPNGWVYSISGQIMRAADGVSYEGPGIPPDVHQENSTEALKMGIDDILELAIEMIL